MSGVRFTAWLSRQERKGVKELAQEYNTSDNFIVRLAVRQFLTNHGKLVRVSKTYSRQTPPDLVR